MNVGPEVFGEDYLYFYEPLLTAQRSDEETGLIWRVLGLEPGSTVLDLACGHGRIANRLAMRGARVTGLDADPTFLARARQDARTLDVDVDYVEGDMRALPWEEQFDAVALWFTAFGYFDDEGNDAVLREIRRALRPGGRVAIEMNHLAWLLRRHQPQSFVQRGDDLMLDERTWHPASSVMETRRVTVRDGRMREATFSIRMYMPAELGAALARAGFSAVQLLGESGEPIRDDSRRLVAVAVR